MNEVKVKVSIEDKEAIADLKRIGGAFDSLSIGAQKAAKGTEKLKTESSGAMRALKGFVTFEMAKKVFAFADATLRGAKEMKGLSKEARAGADAYVDIADSVSKTGAAIVLWASSLGVSNEKMGFFHKLAVETADAWAFTVGMQTKSQQMIANQNAKSNLGADIIIARGNLANIKDQLEKDQNNGTFYLMLQESAKETEDQIRSLGASLQWTDTQMKMLFAGKSLKAIGNATNVATFSEGLNAKGVTPKDKTVKEIDWEKIKSDRLDALADLLDKNTEIVEAQKKVELDYQAWHTDIKKAQAEQDKALAKDIAETESNLRKKSQEEQLMSLQAGFGATAQMAGALSQLATVSAGKNKELAKDALTLSQVVAIANVAEGVTKAFAQGGVLGFVTGGAVGIAGLAQIATIEQQKQKLADGGIIRGPSTGDTVQVQANGGEMMLTKSDQASVLQLIRGGGSTGGGITYAPVINSSNPAQVKQMLRENKSEFESFIFSAIRNPSNSRARAFA